MLKVWIIRFACCRSFNFVAYLYLFADNRLLFLVPRWRHLPTQVFCWNLTSWPGRTEMGRGRRTPSPRSGTPWTTFGPDSERGGGRRPQLLNLSRVSIPPPTWSQVIVFDYILKPFSLIANAKLDMQFWKEKHLFYLHFPRDYTAIHFTIFTPVHNSTFLFIWCCKEQAQPCNKLCWYRRSLPISRR